MFREIVVLLLNINESILETTADSSAKTPRYDTDSGVKYLRIWGSTNAFGGSILYTDQSKIEFIRLRNSWIRGINPTCHFGY